ncbi:serine/threonine-protein kinase [Planobispora longispora]|uniref:non-specific serine/threonine protein kinase n=1 Tax=Planobispora longispora TaxID=28887 RepID=A0A8J3W7Y1_9ACTN|nr:serine/threonine-protein kinase [Planobispora longispora]GIH79340.1 serine/threonine protein kinase [Planobispora longispora]
MAHPHGERAIAGRYRLLRELGRGGMGVVWEGHDTLLDRPVAVKEVLLPPNLSPAEHERQLTRTSREARTAARLSHRGIVAVYDVAEEDGRPWIIMELVRARGLDQIGPLPVRQVAEIGRQVLSALHTAHQAGILHRDVKPSNILLTSDGRAVLTDFGIATVEGDVSLTQTGMVTGSPSFLAPERATGAAAGPWSDLWALGATMYAMLVGQAPFERHNAIATLGALLTEEPDFGRVPPEMYEVLSGLLRREPAHRLTAEQADLLLAEASGDPAATARRTGQNPSPGMPVAYSGQAVPAQTHSTHALPGHGQPGQGYPGQVRPAQTYPGHAQPGRTHGGHTHPGQLHAGQLHAGQLHAGPVHPGQGPGRPLPPPPRQPRRSPVALIVALVVVLLAGAGTAVWATRGSEKTTADGATTAPAEPDASPTGRKKAGKSEKKKDAPAPSPTPEPSDPGPIVAKPELGPYVSDEGGWSIQRPADWMESIPDEETIRWSRPGGGAFMSVSGTNLVLNLESMRDSAREVVREGATILSEESARVSESSNEALDWAFTWRLNEGASSDWASPGVVYHETRRFIAVGDEAAVLTWVVPADEWRKLPDMARGVFDTFEISGDIS